MTVKELEEEEDMASGDSSIPSVSAGGQFSVVATRGSSAKGSAGAGADDSRLRRRGGAKPKPVASAGSAGTVEIDDESAFQVVDDSRSRDAAHEAFSKRSEERNAPDMSAYPKWAASLKAREGAYAPPSSGGVSAASSWIGSRRTAGEQERSRRDDRDGDRDQRERRDDRRDYGRDRRDRDRDRDYDYQSSGGSRRRWIQK